MTKHWLWYAVGRLLVYWLFFFAAFAAFTFSPYWINGWSVSLAMYASCGGFSLWGAAMANLAHEIGKRK